MQYCHFAPLRSSPYARTSSVTDNILRACYTEVARA